MSTPPALALAAITSALLMSGPVLAEQPLDSLRWRHRVVLVFSPGADDARAAQLDARLHTRACELSDRDVVVVRVTGDTVASGETALPAGAARRLREFHGIARAGFAALLLGKDGGRKLASDEVPDLDAWLARIDAMPMRAEEMRARAARCTS